MPSTRSTAPRGRARALVVAATMVAATLAGLVAAPPALAGPQTLLNDAFTGSATSSPVMGLGSTGLPCLTAGTDTSATPVAGCNLPTPDAPGAGALRLTNAAAQQGSALLFNTSIPTSQGLAITFDQYQYGGGGADGINFVVAAAPPQPTTIGQFGGHLGYSGGSAAPAGDGLPNGYLGVGFDTFGNYGRTSFDGSGCSGVDYPTASDSSQPNEVSVRGPGNATAGYCLVSSSGALAFALRGSARVDAKRSVQIVLDPGASTYTVGIDPAGGTTYQTVTSGSLPLPIPPRVTFGFVGSTGDVTDIHEITDVMASTITGGVPVLGLTKTDSTVGGTTPPGSSFSYTLTPSVASGATETLPGTIHVTDPLPSGLSVSAAPSGGSWGCSQPDSSSTNVSCLYQGTSPIGVGTTLPPITVPVNVSATIASGPIQNVATVLSNDAASPVTATDSVNVVGALSNLAMTTSTPQVPAGRQATPLAAVPQSALAPTLGSVLDAPFRASPFRASPFRASPFRASPFRASPFRASPFRASSFLGSPFRASSVPITLDQVPLLPPDSWTIELAGTPLAGVPIQNVTLAQVLGLPNPPPVTLGQFDLSATPMRNVTVEAFLLGTTPLSSLPGTACATLTTQPVSCAQLDPAQASAVDYELAGDDLRPYYDATPIPLASLASPPLVNSPMTGALINDWAFDQSPVGGLGASALAGTGILTCSPPTAPCDTLADAEDSGSVATTATVGELFTLLPAAIRGFTLKDLIPAIVASQNLPAETVDLATLESLAPLPAPNAPGVASYQIDLDVDCSTSAGLTLQPSLPQGFRPIPNSVSMRIFGEVPVPALMDPTTGAITPVSPLSCTPGGVPVSVDFQAEPGPALSGPLATPTAQTSSVTASTRGGTATASNQAPLTVVDGTDETQSAGSPPSTPITSDTLYLGHLASPGDVDYFGLDASQIQPGSTVTVTLSHIPTGQDYDLMVYGQQTLQLRPLDETSPFRASPFRASPFRASPYKASPVGDQSLSLDSSPTATPTEALQDVPIVPGLGIRGASVQRGSQDESVQFVSLAGDTTPFLIQVSGYNGSASTQPYMLRAHVQAPAAPLPCPPRAYNLGGKTAALPATPLPHSTQALILVNAKRLGDMYGRTAESSVMAVLNKLAAVPADGTIAGPMGAVIPVDGDPTVAADYANWDAHNCDVAAANQVVTDVNKVVDRMRKGLPDLRYIVMVGNDEALPFGRVPDLGPLGNEKGFDGASFGGMDNATSSALRAGYVLSDDPYGDFSPTPWFNGELFVPQVALGRLVETPTDIVNAVKEYLHLGGRFTPNAGLTTGYDFMTPAADLVNAALSTQVKSTEVAPPNDPNWSRSDLVNGNPLATTPIPALSTVAGGFISLNAHYDQYRAESALDFNGGTPDQAITTADLPASLQNGILFTMGCHAGLNLADVLVASPTTAEAARLADWSQTVSARGGLFAANTGFGEGDSAVVAYSERVIAYYAQNLNGQMTIGQALMFAKQHYLALGAPSVYDAKALEENVFYGLPMYKLGAAGISAPSVVPPPPPPPPTTVTTAVVTAGFTNGSPTPLTLHQDAAGHEWYTVGSQLPQTTPREPVMPLTALTMTPRTDGLSAHGALIEQLTSVEQPGFIPLFDFPVTDQNAGSDRSAITDSAFPSVLDAVDHILTPQGPRDVLTVVPEQFSSEHGARTFNSVQSDVEYSNSDNYQPPTIGPVSATVQGTTATFSVSTPSTDVTRAVVLFLPQPGSGGGDTWSHVDLGNIGGGQWLGTGTLPAALANQPVGQYIVELLDAAGNVATSSDKGVTFEAPVGLGTPFTISGSPPSAVPANVVYSFALSLGGSPPPTASITAGSLPPGLTLSPMGLISGVPVTAGTYTASVTASSAGVPEASEGVTIVVIATATITPNTGPPGTTAKVRGAGFLPGETVTVVKYKQIETTPPSGPYSVIGTAVVAADGTFKCSVTIPTGAAAGVPGPHDIVAKGITSLIKTRTPFLLT
jgi:Bacterial lectin